MHSTIDSARKRAHLSRHERQRLARAEAFSRRTVTARPVAQVVVLEPSDVALIERLVHHGRTAVSSSVLAVAGIGAGEVRRCAVLAEVGQAADTAKREGAISCERGAQIARHVKAALEATEARDRGRGLTRERRG